MEKDTYFVAKDTCKIRGTLTLPQTDQKPPICLFIGGSFPQTRDGNLDNSNTDWFPVPLPQRNLFKDEAKLLENMGIATFRYDKRGSGESEGNFDTASLLDFLDDARSALQWLRTLSEIDATKTYVLGQSEGAYLALILASETPDLSGYIWQGGIYNNLETVLRWQAQEFLKLDPPKIDKLKQTLPMMYWGYKEMDLLWQQVKQGKTHFKRGHESWSKKYNPILFRQHLEYPPSQFVSQVKCPVLLLHGELDHNTPYTEALLTEKALVASNNNQVTTHILSGLDHSFRRLGDPDEDFIQAMKRPLDSQMTQVLVDWFMKNV
ncbi:MAG: alpha/beta hydrolase family protein [Microcystaceae cyanobacterium]